VRPEPTPKPIDRWLGILSLVIGIVFVLVPKNRPTIVIGLSLIFVLLIHPIWNFWWIERGSGRRFAALALVAGLVFWLGMKVWPPRYALWLNTNATTVDAAGRADAMAVSFIIRGTDSLYKNPILPSIPFHGLRITVNMPVLMRTDDPGWNECTLVRTATIPVWSNRDLTLANLGFLDLVREYTLLHATASDDMADWDIVVVLALVNGKLQSREVVIGRFFDDRSEVRIDEATEGFPKTELNVPLQWDPTLLKRYRVPAAPMGKVNPTCPTLRF
jgi:hypothetical protein